MAHSWLRGYPARRPGDTASNLYAQLQNGAPECFGLFRFPGVCIEQNQRMQIAVAGMEYVGHPQAVLGGQFLDTNALSGVHSGPSRTSL
jgi:hypothetical protein